MLRAAILMTISFALAAPAAEATSSAAAIPWFRSTCGSLVALQHDAGRLRVAPTAASTRTLAAAVDSELSTLLRTTSYVPAVPGGATIAANLSDTVRAVSRSVSGRGRSAATLGAAHTYAAAVDGGSQALGAAFLRLVSGNGTPALDRAVEQVPACEVVRG